MHAAGIAAAGLLINIAYYGMESLDGSPFVDHFLRRPLDQGFIACLIIVFAIIAVITKRILTGFRRSERSRALEREVNHG